MECAVAFTLTDLEAFCNELRLRERSAGTITQYRRTLLQLWDFLKEDKRLDRETLLNWKQEITAGHSVRTVNCMIAAVNTFLEHIAAAELKLKTLRYQRKTFSEDELSQEEFCALVERAKQEGDEQMAMLLFAMSGSGVRVSEVQFLTVEAAQQKAAVISLKGKTRRVPLSEKICSELLRFAKRRGIASGPIFLGKKGGPLDRRRIWEGMKRLCVGTGVDPKKVHPHALRHLFARLFYELTKDIAKLADVLGHGSIETTRIYVITSCREHRDILNRLTSCLGTKKPSHKDGIKRRRT